MTEKQPIAGKFTGPILRYLQAQDKPRSAYEILDELREHGAKAPMQIYRALAKLEEAGLAHKLPKSNGWIACDGHHHDSVKQMLILWHSRRSTRCRNSICNGWFNGGKEF